MVTKHAEETQPKSIYIPLFPLWFTNPGTGLYDVAVTLLNNASVSGVFIIFPPIQRHKGFENPEDYFKNFPSGIAILKIASSSDVRLK